MATGMDDRELIQRYAQAQDHEAFAQLVRRHGDWVYSSARRQVGDSHLAEDITQAVFLLLSRRARTLGSYAYLSGWLFKTLRYCAKAAIRQRSRRQHHERQAAAMQCSPTSPDPDWSDLSPILDEALARIKTSDREAVLLRFYEQKPLAEVGRLLGITEEAARKRVDRAVDKLRQHMAGRGVEAQSLGLSGLLLARAVDGCPAGLVEKITASAGLGTGTGTAGAIARGAAEMMAMAKVKVTASLVCTLLVGVATVAAVTAAAPAGGTAAASTQPVTPTRETKGQQISAEVLLSRYEQALGRVSRIHYLATIRVRSEGDFNFDSLQRLQVWKFDVAWDGQRFGLSRELLGYADGDPADPPSRRIVSRLVVADQEYWHERYGDEQVPDALAITPRNVDTARRARWITGADALLSGIHVDADGTVAGVMRSPGSVMAHPKTEEVAGKPVYVLKSTGKYGRYTLWLDKESCLPLRVAVHKEADDLVGRMRLSTKFTPDPDCTYDIPLSPEKTRDMVMDEIQIERRADTYVPLGAKVTSVSVYEDGKATRQQSIVSRTAIDLAPDFAALGSFEVGVPEGTPVHFTDEARRRAKFEWRNGKAVPVDGSAASKMRGPALP